MVVVIFLNALVNFQIGSNEYKLSAVGKRGSTMDFGELLHYLRDIDLVPLKVRVCV